MKMEREIIRRLEKLEKAVFGDGAKKKVTDKRSRSNSGPSGGIRLLIDEGFFSSARSLMETCAALKQKKYHYSNIVVSNALRRLAKIRGPLVVIKSVKPHTYVERK